MKNAARWLLAVFCVGVAGYAFFAYAILEPGTTVAPAMKATYREHPFRILSHIFASIVALVTGPFQFFPSLRNRHSLHRGLGFIYFGSVAVGGLAGFAMAFIAYGGLASRLGFGTLAVLWLYTGARALLAVRNRDFVMHEIWAIRCFALTFAAVMLRIYLGLFFSAGVAFDAFYPAISWLCWVPNILIVEWVLLKPSLARQSV